MMEFKFLFVQQFVPGQGVGAADIVMGTNDKRVAGMVEKRPDGSDFRFACLLFCSGRVEADDDERRDAVEKFGVERAQARISPAFRAPHGISSPGRSQFGEHLEIRELYVVEKSANALIVFLRIGELLHPWPEDSAQFEQRRKSILQCGKRCADLIGATPGEIQ